ncbi:MAG TPA: GNAT family N-acetyltransferase [Candidatus Limnocylindrales bacterium]|nr:GNAT family N-acetyltransferase [Candidatus Limnocylindrales bacterium]
MASVAQAGERAESRLVARPTTDRVLLRGILDADRLYAAYAICDLDEREFRRTRWAVAFDAERPVALVLEYGGLSPQPLFVMGDPDGVAVALRNVIHPRAAYLAALPEHLDAVGRVYRVEPGPPMLRMWVDREHFRPAPGAAARLLPAEIGDLNRLYDLGLTSWLPAESVANGVYYGIRVGGRLVAAAGTHVVSPDAGLAAVGNVMTHRDFRGRGYAKITTSAVTQELLRTCRQVVLNVRSDNPPAIAAYRALGYQEYRRFEERLVHRRGSTWDSIVGPLRRLFLPAGRPE